MTGSIHGLSYLPNLAGDTGRGFVMDAHHRLDLLVDIVAQLGFNCFGRDAVAPIAWDKVDGHTEVRCQLSPQRSEMAGLEHQHPIAG